MDLEKLNITAIELDQLLGAPDADLDFKNDEDGLNSFLYRLFSMRGDTEQAATYLEAIRDTDLRDALLMDDLIL